MLSVHAVVVHPFVLFAKVMEYIVASYRQIHSDDEASVIVEPIRRQPGSRLHSSLEE
jgi:hypothetical protein